MKIISRPVEMIAWFHQKQWPEPVKFRLRGADGTLTTIRVDRIAEVREEKRAGIRSYVYRCQSLVEEQQRVYELQYLVEECRWVLYKM